MIGFGIALSEPQLVATAGGGGTPSNAYTDESGNILTDESGNILVQES